MKATTDAYKTTWLIRRLFRAMAEKADGYLQESGITAADRAVMEFLYPDSALTVPDIAGRYQVSRQHVQVTANRLIEEGLLISSDNPRHKLSPLLRLSERGSNAGEEIRCNDNEGIDELGSDI